MNKIPLKDFTIGNDKLTLLAGPCAIEDNRELMFSTAKALKDICLELDINFVFKSSFDKANRTSINSYRGIGINKGLAMLAEIKKELNVPIVTDIHLPEQAQKVAEVADILQIPSFLSRQTDLLVAAAATGKIVNIKKGQFMAPEQMEFSAKKVLESGNDKILFTERGTTFGYGNLVSDMRSISIMQKLGYPVIFDATHSVQTPSGATTSGKREFVSLLAKSAMAAGANGLFMEVHPNPDNAPCDGANMIPLADVKELLKICKAIFQL